MDMFSRRDNPETTSSPGGRLAPRSSCRRTPRYLGHWWAWPPSDRLTEAPRHQGFHPQRWRGVHGGWGSWDTRHGQQAQVYDAEWATMNPSASQLAGGELRRSACRR